MKADDISEKYHVRCSWVRLLKQRRRETGEVARVRSATAARLLAPHVHTLAALIQEQPDRTLAEIEDPLGTPASLGATGVTCGRVT